jgi:hypothetical protein
VTLVGAGAAAQPAGVLLLPTLKVKSAAVGVPGRLGMSTITPLSPR